MDIILQKLFEKTRWEKAIQKGLEKEMNKDLLRQAADPMFRLQIYRQIRDGNYKISPPHEARIPKDDGTFRTVYVNENIDRLILSIINDIFFELCSELIHPCCVSYKQGIGCGKIVQKTSAVVNAQTESEFGVKIDLSKYFDSVPLRYVDEIFDNIDKICGKSIITDIVRAYYHDDTVLDIDKNPIQKFSSLRQGCAVAAFLADAALENIDREISENFNVYYVRYSDDIIIIGRDWQKAYDRLKNMLSEKELILNPKKVETLHKDKWFKFLGFTLKNDKISLSQTRIKSFQKEIENRTVKCSAKNKDLRSIIKSVQSYLYKGNGEYSWSTSVLPIINTEQDINTLNNYAMDAIRAAALNNTRIGGLGFISTDPDRTICRGQGRYVRSNRTKIPNLPDYMTINCMKQILNTSKNVFNMIIHSM